jgi:hypothetical protein
MSGGLSRVRQMRYSLKFRWLQLRMPSSEERDQTTVAA